MGLTQAMTRPRLQLIQPGDCLQIRVLRTAADLREADHLVCLAYEDAGKTTQWKSALDPRGELDPRRIRVLGFYFGGHCIGSAVLHFPERQGDDLPFAFLPDEVQRVGIRQGLLPKPEECIEISRLALDRDYRGLGILKLIFQRFHRELRLSGRSTLLISSDQRLLNKYRSVTFRAVGLHYFKRQQHHTDRLNVMVSRQKHLGSYAIAVDPIRWCLFVKDAVAELRAERKLQLTLLESLLYPIYSLFDPLARRLERRWLEKNGYLRAEVPPAPGSIRVLRQSR